MKIIHINYSDLQGGASIACNRLHNALINEKIDSNLVVVNKLSNNNSVFTFNKKSSKIFFKIKMSISRILSKVFEFRKNNNYSFNIFDSKISDITKRLNSDIIHIHWICNETFPLSELKEIEKPIVWTLCDMWPFLGAEHVTYNFNKKDYWNDLKILNSKRLHFNHMVLKNKMKKSDFHFKVVAISEWLGNQAKKSLLLKDKDIRVIPCCIDFNLWKPYEKEKVKKKLKLKRNKKIILFISSGNTIDKKKGFEILLKSFKLIRNKSDYHLVVVGTIHKSHKKNLCLEYTEYKKFYFGKSSTLREIYSSSDLIVIPSLVEAFGQVSLEAAACNVPSLAFKNTGLTEIIVHKQNGYLANYNSPEDLAYGLEWCLNSKNNNFISKNARIMAKKKFSHKIVAKLYRDLYKSLI